MLGLTKQNRYDLMEGQQVEEFDPIYPDCLSIDLDAFTLTSPGKDEVVYQENVIRPDIFFDNKMGTNNLEDIVLWINAIPSRRDLSEGIILNIPSKSDISSFFIKNRKLN